MLKIMLIKLSLYNTVKAFVYSKPNVLINKDQGELFNDKFSLWNSADMIKNVKILMIYEIFFFFLHNSK